jgi:hypothetical protein
LSDKLPRGNDARAEHGGEMAYDTLEWARTQPKPPERREMREAAAVYARIAETFAMRDLADAHRELAKSNDRLALSYDVLTDEMRRRRGVPEDSR